MKLDINENNVQDIKVVIDAALAYQDYIEGVILSHPSTDKMVPTKIPDAISRLQSEILSQSES